MKDFLKIQKFQSICTLCLVVVERLFLNAHTVDQMEKVYLVNIPDAALVNLVLASGFHVQEY